MFNTKQKHYSWKSLVITTNSYNDTISTYKDAETVKMFIALNTHNEYTSNSTVLTECEYVGITSCKGIKKGDLINNSLEVRFVNDDVKPYIIYLKEINNNGTNNI